jgi:hypothetical protein
MRRPSREGGRAGSGEKPRRGSKPKGGARCTRAGNGGRHFGLVGGARPWSRAAAPLSQESGCGGEQGSTTRWKAGHHFGEGRTLPGEGDIDGAAQSAMTASRSTRGSAVLRHGRPAHRRRWGLRCFGIGSWEATGGPREPSELREAHLATGEASAGPSTRREAWVRPRERSMQRARGGNPGTAKAHARPPSGASPRMRRDLETGSAKKDDVLAGARATASWVAAGQREGRKCPARCHAVPDHRPTRGRRTSVRRAWSGSPAKPGALFRRCVLVNGRRAAWSS